MKAVLQISFSVLRMYMREPLTVFFSLGLLLLMMLLFSTVAGTDLANVRFRVALFDPSGSSAVAAALRQDPLLDLKEMASEQDLENSVRRGETLAGALLFPLKPDSRSPATRARILINKNANGNIDTMALDHLRPVLEGFAAPVRSNVAIERLEGSAVGRRFIDFIFPGVLALAILQTCLGSAVVLLDAGKNGMLRRMTLAPIHQIQIHAGLLMGRICIVGLHLVVLTGVAVAAFRVHILASFHEFLIVVAIGTATFMAMASVIAVFSPNIETAALVAQLLNFPMAFLCGVFFRVDNMPVSLAWLARLLPLTYLTETIRGLTVEGLSIRAFYSDLFALLAWLAGLLTLLYLGGSYVRARNQ